jgi:hypothetical protein
MCSVFAIFPVSLLRRSENELLQESHFLILNRRSGESVTGPGLIVHLIREHQFFEGSESPYRLEPSKAIRVLELASGL